jgi:hypothetical protein
MIEMEEQMLRQRIDRLKQRSIEIFKDLRGKTIKLFQLMEDKVGSTYKHEIGAAKNLSLIIKDCIESDQKLSNQILLQNEKLLIDFSSLVIEPKAAPRPQSPQERISDSTQFTVAQLQKIGTELFQISQTGVISASLMVEYFVKLAIFEGGQDPLPEAYMSLDPLNFQKILLPLDPYDTGLLNWKKFWLIASRILPISLSALEALKQIYRKSATITKEEFMKIPLWFEKYTAAPGIFNRPQKLKSILFGNSPFNNRNILQASNR